jgi:hypothetical protein
MSKVECKTWSLILREERRLRVFGNRVLRRILGPKRNEAKREWRKLHKEELNNLVLLTQYCSGDKIEDEMGETCSEHGERRGVHRVLVENLRERDHLGKLRERDHLGNPGVYGKMILIWIFRK